MIGFWTSPHYYIITMGEEKGQDEKPARVMLAGRIW